VRKYKALLAQSGTDAPVATVLENSLGGTVVWTRTDAGDYLATLSGAFPETKTFIHNKERSWYGGSSNYFRLNRTGDNTIRLRSGDDTGTYDDMISNVPGEYGPFPILIEVYP
jgi:hypothetical protein